MIKYKIRTYTYRREAAIKEYNSDLMRRMLRIHNTKHLDFFLHSKYINWYLQKWNLYYSMAIYKDGIPKVPFGKFKRDFGNWKHDHWKDMEGYDYLIDIDADSHKDITKAQRSALIVAKRFQDTNVPFDIRFSGCGFHIIVPYSHFKKGKYSFDPTSDRSIYKIYSLIGKKLNEELSYMIDFSLNDSRRLCKIPYSLALYSRDHIYVCTPLTVKELKKFTLDYVKPKAVLERLKLAEMIKRPINL